MDIYEELGVRRLRQREGCLQRFEIRQVDEMPGHLEMEPNAEPGSRDHILEHLPWLLSIVARTTTESTGDFNDQTARNEP